VAIDEQIDVAGLAQRHFAVSHLSEQRAFKDRNRDVVFFEELVDAKLFADEMENAL
jgi:hypothetical protein